MKPLRTCSSGEKLRPDARCPIQFVGDPSEAGILPSVEVMVDQPDIVWTEGPLWRNDDDDGDGTGTLFFTGPIDGNMYRLGPDDPSPDSPLRPHAVFAGGVDPRDSRYAHLAEPGPNGTALDPADSRAAYVCQQGARRVVHCHISEHRRGAPLEECPGFRVICNRNHEGNPLNSPNDVIVSSDGAVWFTDPIYGMLEKERFCDEFVDGASYLDARAGEECGGIKGVYRVDPATEEVALVTALHRRPNGLAFSPDGQRLWVADSTVGSPSWTAYPVGEGWEGPDTPLAADQVITQALLGRVLGSAGTPLLGHEGISDGFKVDDRRGWLWTSVPNGFAVIDPGSGAGRRPRLVCEIVFGINISNCVFGDDGEVWITGSGGVYRIRCVQDPII